MRIRGNVLPLAAASVMVFPLLWTCTPTRQAVRPEGTGMRLRLPPVEAMDISLRSGRQEPPLTPPYSVADESRGRWLTLFELTASHLGKENLSETGSGEWQDRLTP